MPDFVFGDYHSCLVGEDEDKRPAFADDGKRLIAGIEDKCPDHLISDLPDAKG
jgi:hypothetical protein